MPVPRALRTITDVLAEPVFARYIGGNTVSLIGGWIQRTTVGWLAWDLTGSATWLGIVAFADLFPALLIGPFGGVLADRHDRRLMLIRAQAAMLLVAVALAVLSLSGMLDIWLLTASVAVQGSLVGFAQPARLALIPALISRERLPGAIALNSVIFNLARFVGPAIAGVLIVAVGPATAFIVNALSYVPLLVVLRYIRPLEAVSLRPHGSLMQELTEGMAYVVRSPVLFPVFTLYIAASLTVRPVGELLPGFADAVFDHGAGGLALLSSSLGFGAVAGGLWVAQAATEDRFGLVMRAQGALAAACILFALSPSIFLGMVMIAATGAALIIAGITTQTLVQLSVPTDLRGRVMSLFGLVFRSAPAIGALLLGVIADFFGLRTGLLLGAAAFALVMLTYHLKGWGRTVPGIGD